MSARRAPLACLALALLLVVIAPAPARADFGIKSFSVSALEENGSVDTRAASHPYSFNVELEMDLDEEGSPGGPMRSFIIELPPGLAGNPLATPRCTGAQFEGEISFCPGNTQVGVARVPVFGLGEAVTPVYNLVPPLGVPAAFGLAIFGNLSLQEASLRTGSDYGVNVSDITLPTNLELQGFTAEIWGVPHDDRHNAERVCVNSVTGFFFTGCDVETTPAPFLTLPTSCSEPLGFTIKVESLQEPGVIHEASTETLDEHGEAVGLDSCSKPPFKPTLTALPETNLADSPSGLRVDLHLPQNDAVTIEELEARNEVQQLVVDAEGGAFTLTFKVQSTGEIPFNASAAEVQSELEALETIGAGNVALSAGAGGTYTITFANALSEEDVPLIKAQFTGEGEAEVSVLAQGRPEGLFGAEPMLATAHLKDTVVALPPGMTVNPSSADGLGACAAAQIDLSGPGAAQCPESSKLGEVEVGTPLLDHPVKGAVYLAKQGENPFGSLIAIYVAVEDPLSGVVVKLAGKVEPDPVTGQLITRFEDNPQLPFEDFELDFAGGPRAALTTPPTCGTYTTTTQLTPWSAPEGADAFPASAFPIAAGPNGGPCASTEAQLPHDPSLQAGTTLPLAAGYSPFVLRLSRENGSQRLGAVSATLPPGLVGKLAGVERCTEAQLALAASRNEPGEGALEQASPSCPAASQVGTVTVGAGSGAPLHVQGTAYLAGPYKGAPLSLAIITPALAGPFDLGAVLVRAAAHVDPKTAQIRVKSDPIPTILEGIPLDVRSVAVDMNRDRFTLNPTNCEPMSLDVDALSSLGQSALLSNRFQVDGCRGLDFEPRFALRLKGGTKRGDNPKLIATVRAKEGEANIARAQVKLPRSAFLDQAHIRTVCTRVQFAAEACPGGSIYGKATATTPLLDEPLTGNVYLRSSNNKLPDLVVDLRGPASLPIRIELAGRTDSLRGALRNTFDLVPDAPVSSFRLELFGGKRGLVVNSTNICSKAFRATVKLRAHSGAAHEATPVVRSECGKASRSHRRGGGW